MIQGQYEIVFYAKEGGRRHEETWGIQHQAVNRARNLIDLGYYPVVVYDKWKQQWVDLDENR